MKSLACLVNLFKAYTFLIQTLFKNHFQIINYHYQGGGLMVYALAWLLGVPLGLLVVVWLLTHLLG
jgi:hypothetical protein